MQWLHVEEKNVNIVQRLRVELFIEAMGGESVKLRHSLRVCALTSTKK